MQKILQQKTQAEQGVAEEPDEGVLRCAAGEDLAARCQARPRCQAQHMRNGARREPPSRFAELEGTAAAVLRELAKKSAEEGRSRRSSSRRRCRRRQMQTSWVLQKDYESWSWSVPSGLSLGIHHPLRQRPWWPSADLRALPCGVAHADGGVHRLLQEGGAVLHKWRRDVAKKKKQKKEERPKRHSQWRPRGCQQSCCAD